MPVFHRIKRKKSVTEKETLSVDNIEEFIAQEGEEKAKIYIQALYDFTESLYEATHHQFKDKRHFMDKRSEVPNTPHITRKLTKKMFHDNQQLLEKAIDILNLNPYDPSTSNKPDPMQ